MSTRSPGRVGAVAGDVVQHRPDDRIAVLHRRAGRAEDVVREPDDALLGAHHAEPVRLVGEPALGERRARPVPRTARSATPPGRAPRAGPARRRPSPARRNAWISRGERAVPVQVGSCWASSWRSRPVVARIPATTWSWMTRCSARYRSGERRSNSASSTSRVRSCGVSPPGRLTTNGRRCSHAHTVGASGPTVSRSRSSVVSQACAQVARPIMCASEGASRSSDSSRTAIRSGTSASRSGTTPVAATSASSASASG